MLLTTWLVCALSLGAMGAKAGEPCYPDLADPVLVFAGIEDAGSGVRFLLNVENWDSFPPELFELRADLGPCGENPMPSRTWVDIYDQDDTRLGGFCALSDPSHLNSIWFFEPDCESAPQGVYITLTDRLCEIVYTSNVENVECVVSVEDDSWAGVKEKYR